MAKQAKQTAPAGQVIGAIDFGTCNTRMAFGLKVTGKKPIRRLVDNWERAPLGGNKVAPTSILFDRKGEVMAYGWEAEAKFCELEEEERTQHAFFKNFKMELHRKKVSSDRKVLGIVWACVSATVRFQCAAHPFLIACVPQR